LTEAAVAIASPSSATPTRLVDLDVEGQRVRVGTRPGRGGVPLLLFNGIGANLELLEPLLAALDGIETIVFDVPGVGGSPAPRWPYRLRQLARLATRVLARLGHDGAVDVLGVSWGGALAQQFAFQYPRRCRRLVLAATSAGSLMVPGRLSVIAGMANPRRYRDPAHLRDKGPALYGGALRTRPDLLQRHGRHVRVPHGRGYLYQLLATLGWTSLPWLPLLRQPTLVMAGTDDPIIPLVNARLLARLIRRARLHVVDDGHLFLVTGAAEHAATIRAFLEEPMA
jgi:poly(3-hydroxyalkanoate) depolymerase